MPLHCIVLVAILRIVSWCSDAAGSGIFARPGCTTRSGLQQIYEFVVPEPVG